ncbi:ATP-binding protein [Noviherbaspirillum sp. CPCC 100848]|uniref:histidine kinase n=1 Tax=Noviherbaspirillum album TaxID=3080276 RepID=A0ABU6JHS4_9BURK|nr:ATP-binding protein [Noviherbaspirillum sp. CPCC 100848]MEC4723073.1 ATP-binding protein [Noviherbaspirillum sp. CPCC 100848]
MKKETHSSSQDDVRVRQAIDRVVEAVRGGHSGSEEIQDLLSLVSQLREANQNLVLAAVKAQVLQETAETRNRQQNEFLAMLAHELRNPIAPISNAASLLEKMTSAHPLLPKIQGVISRQVTHMARLIDDLLDASRITSGKVSLERSRITVNDILNRALEVVRSTIDQRHQQLLAEPLENDVMVEGDLIRLAQAMSNILVNASKFTPEGGKVTVLLKRHGDAVHFVVRDSGIGIESELLPHIFELFRQGPRTLARSEGGLGIGLSVTKALVEMHGGRIAAHSMGRDMGSEFEIVLPVAQDAPQGTAGEDPAPLAAPAACCRILLIEDNPDTSATLQLLLELSGHRVTVAPDGLSGVSLAKTNTYDVILCDIGLPGLNGYGVIRQVRQLEATHQPYAIAISGYGQPEDRARAIGAGFNEYLVKPVKTDTVLGLIATQGAAA